MSLGVAAGRLALARLSWTGAAVEILDKKEDEEVERVRFLGHQVKGERCSI